MARRLRISRWFLVLLNGVVILTLLYMVSHYSYLLFHSLVEVFSVVVAGGIFMIAWNTRRLTEDRFLLFLGIAYLFVAGLDLIHTLAYRGMGVFPTYDANLPTQLWIAARYLESLSLLVALLALERKPGEYRLFGAYAAVTALLLFVIFAGFFPDCYVEGVGLTSFKKVSEYVICSILLVAWIVLYCQRQRFDRTVLHLLMASIVTTIASELAFTFYVSVYGLSNLVGHLFKIVSFYLVYKAIIETGLMRPFDLLFRDLKQSEAALRRHAAELEARNEELDAYAHTVAHDLKNPLAVVIGFAQALEEALGALSEKELRHYLRRIAGVAHKMRDIVDGLLLLAAVRKVEDIEVEPLDMGHIMDEVKIRLAPLIHTHKAEIVTPAEWPVVLGYAPWVEEVWVNYVSNAIKYGGQPPRVELGATVQGRGDEGASEEGKMVRFWVKDNGVGIAPEERGRLFQPFSQLERTPSRGHGLGLSIVRRIVTRLHGQVDVESEVGQGSVFSFTLPIAIRPGAHGEGLEGVSPGQERR